MYKVELTPDAKEMLKNIRDRRALKQISKKIDGLENSPEQQGAPLHRGLAGCRKLYAAGRYRIVYRVKNTAFQDTEGVDFEGIVEVVGVGLRKDGGKGDVYRLLS